MKRREAIAALPLLASLPAFAQGSPAAPAPAPPPPPVATLTATDELKALLEKQAKQWSSGDIEGFCAHYAEDCLFLSPGGLTRGRKEVLDRYRKKYVDKAAMGTLTLEVIGATTRPDHASVAMRYTLSYSDRPKATGLSLIALEKVSDKWKIVHDASM